VSIISFSFKAIFRIRIVAGFINTVRFLVKEECVDEFVRRHHEPDRIDQQGIGIKQ